MNEGFMNCTMCGAIIPTGQTNCPMCGAPVQAEQPADNAQPVQPQMGYQQPMGQPVQPQMGYQQPAGQPVQPQQPMGGYYQPRSNNAAAFGAGINGYLGYVKENPMNILKIVGAFFVFLATLIPWAHATYWGVTEHWNLFKAGGFNRFIAIIVLLLSLVLIAWEVADFIPVPQIANVKAKLQAIPYFEFILLGVIFVFVLIATIRHGYAHSDGTTINFREYGIKVGISAGVIFAYLGVIAAAAPRVLDKLGIKMRREALEIAYRHKYLVYILFIIMYCDIKQIIHK